MKTFQITATLSFERGQFTDELHGAGVVALHSEFEVSCEGELMFAVRAENAEEAIAKLKKVVGDSPYTLVSHTTPRGD